MQTKESLLYGQRFVSVLGPPSEDVEQIERSAEAVVSEEVVERANPWRDEYGQFTDEANAVFNAAANRPSEELEVRAKEYEKLTRDEITAGKQRGFKNYKPKDAHTGSEPPRWHKLNRAIGKAEGVANAYMKRYRGIGEPDTDEKKKVAKYWLTNAAALRDISGVLREKRDKIKVEKDVPPGEVRVLKESGLPEFIAQAFADLEDVVGVEGDPGEFDADQLRRAKIFIVNNAVQVGLLPREDGDLIIDRIA